MFHSRPGAGYAGPGTVAVTMQPATSTVAVPIQPASSARAPVDRIADLPRVDLLGGAGIGAFKIMGDNAKAAEAKTIPVTGQPFAEAMRFTVKEASSHEWAVQLQTPTTAPVAQGDAILATFYLRTE